MSSYSEIERQRLAKPYVYYEYKRMSTDLDDAWSPGFPWCTYWITANNGVSRRQIFNETMTARSKYTAENYPQFKAIFDAITSVKHVSDDMLTRFDRMITVDYPREIDMNVRLLVYAGANINNQLLLTDIQKCKNKRGLTELFEQLSGQVYITALNGAFAKLFTAAEFALVSPANDPLEANKQIHDLVEYYYFVMTHGSKTYHSIDFPAGQMDFKLPADLYNIGLELDNNPKQQPAEVCRFLEKKLVSLLDTYTRRKKK